MARKGQKFNAYNDHIKEVILEEYKTKRNVKELTKVYYIPKGTIKTWTMKQNHPEMYINKGQRRGNLRKKDLTNEDYKERYEILKKYQAFLKVQREKK